jgi:hypothetical protein
MPKLSLAVISFQRRLERGPFCAPIGGPFWMPIDSRGQPTHQAATTGHPRAFLRLIDAVLSADSAAIPPDLGAVLDDCVAADPSARGDPAFVRLDALRRRSAA